MKPGAQRSQDADPARVGRAVWAIRPLQFGTNVLEGWPTTAADPAIHYVPDQSFKAMAAGNVHALAIRRDGTVTGWGNATGGALEPPTHVRFKAVAAGWGFSVGLSTDGTLWGLGHARQVATLCPGLDI